MYKGELPRSGAAADCGASPYTQFREAELIHPQ